MTRLKSFGFEDEGELTTLTLNGACAIDVSVLSRTGNKRLKLGTGNNAYAQSNWSHNPTEIFFSGAVIANSPLADNVNTLSFGTGLAASPFSSMVNLRWRTGNYIEAFRGLTSIGLSASGVYNPLSLVHIQVWFKPSNTAGTGRLLVKIDDTTVLNITADTTDGQEYCNGVRVHQLRDTYYAYWDDVCINDNNGATNNTYPGLARLQPIRVNGAGENTGLSRGGVDLGANFRQVRDPEDAQSFLQGALNTYDLYTVDVPDLPVGATINNIITSVSGKTVSGSGVVAPLVRGATTQGTGSDYPLTSAGLTINEAWPLNPDDSAAWEEADLANLQIGVKVRS